MYTVKEINKWLKKCNYVYGYPTEEQLKEFMDSHVLIDEGKHDGEVCKFTGKVYCLVDIHSVKHVGYLTEYKTSNGVRLFNQHLLKTEV